MEGEHYQLEKTIWTHDDYDNMGWHDANIYALAIMGLMEVADLYKTSEVEQETNRVTYDWTIELQQGHINLKSYGFRQVVRRQPIYVQAQVLTLEQRGGIGFGLEPG